MFSTSTYFRCFFVLPFAYLSPPLPVVCVTSSRTLCEPPHPCFSVCPAVVNRISQQWLIRNVKKSMGQLARTCAASLARPEGPRLLLTSCPTPWAAAFSLFLQEGYATSRCHFCDPGRKKKGRIKIKRPGLLNCPFLSRKL